MLCYINVVSILQVVSVLLEEGEMLSANKLNRNMMDIPFSDGYISLGVESVPFLAGRPVTIICFPHRHSSLLLTVHNKTALVSIMNDASVQPSIQYITVQCSTGHPQHYPCVNIKKLLRNQVQSSVV
jgi:hypothetical protein